MNSDSEQCTKSKLGWVHQMHTLAQPARTGHAHCAQASHVAAVSWSCRGPVPGRIVACGRSCRKPGRPCRRPGPCLARTARLITCLPGCVVHCIATQSRVATSLSSSPVMIQTLYRNTSPCCAPVVCVAELLRRVARRWALYGSPGCTIS